MRKVTAFLFCVWILSLLTSCYDAKEIDDLLHVVAIGVDQGVSDKWRLTVKVISMEESEKQMSSDESGSPGYVIATIDAPTFFTGIHLLNTSLPRRLNFMHAQVIVFSEEIGKSGVIGEYIAPINRFRQIRRSAHIMVVKGKAYEFLGELQPLIGSSIAKDLQIMMNESKNTGYFPHTTLEDFYIAIKSTTHQPIAPMVSINNPDHFIEEGQPWGTGFQTGGDYMAGELPMTGNSKITLFGTSLFDGDTIVGNLTGDETRFLLMVRDEFKRGFFTMQDPNRADLAIPIDVSSLKSPK